MTKLWSENENVGNWIFNRVFKSRNSVECSIGGIKLAVRWIKKLDMSRSNKILCIFIIPMHCLQVCGASDMFEYCHVCEREYSIQTFWSFDLCWCCQCWGLSRYFQKMTLSFHLKCWPLMDRPLMNANTFLCIFNFRLLLFYHLFWKKLSFNNKGGHLNIFTEINDCKLYSSKWNV